MAPSSWIHSCSRCSGSSQGRPWATSSLKSSVRCQGGLGKSAAKSKPLPLSLFPIPYSLVLVLSIIPEHRMGNQPSVILLVRPIQAGLDNLFPQRIEVRHQELLELRRKELPPLAAHLPRTRPSRPESALPPQKHAWNHRSFNAELVARVDSSHEDVYGHLMRRLEPRLLKPCAQCSLMKSFLCVRSVCWFGYTNGYIGFSQ